MAIDNAEKRRAAAGVGFFVVGPGVTLNALKDLEWRQQATWGYSGIAPSTGSPPALTVAGRFVYGRRFTVKASRR